MTHRLIERLELQCIDKRATFIKSLEKEPLHPLDDPQELDAGAPRRR